MKVKPINPPRWDLNILYEPQIGSILIQPACPHQGDASFRVAIVDLLRGLQVTPAALRGLLEEAAEPAPPVGNLENLCRIAIPEDLSGLTVLDIGGYDGRFARLCLERGARRAICLDSRQWEQYGWTEPPRLPGVEYVQGDFREWQEPVDVALFFNVLYHLENPFAALQHLRTITRQEMILASLTVWSDESIFRLYGARECNPDDDTVFWGPSQAGLFGLLVRTGWQAEKVGRAFERIVVRATPKEAA